MELVVIYLCCTFFGFSIITFLSIQYNQCIYDAEEEILLSVQKDKRKAAADLLLLDSEEQEEQKEEEIAPPHPHNLSHDLPLEASVQQSILSEYYSYGKPCTKCVKTPNMKENIEYWNWEMDGDMYEKSIDSKHQSINITNLKIPKTPKTKTRWSNLKSKAKSIIRKYVPLMSPTKDKP